MAEDGLMQSTSSNDDNNDDDHSFELLPLPVLIPVVVVVSLVMLVAVAGNLLVLVSYMRDPRLRTVSNLYIFHLAICDLLLASVSMPVYLVQTALRLDWPLGKAFCKAFLISDFTMCNQSVYLVILISLDQLQILRMGVHYPAVETRTRAYVKITIAWVASFLVYGPAIIGWDHWRGFSVLEEYECDVEFYGNEAYTSVTAVLDFFIPSLVLITLNAAVYWQIRKRTKVNISVSTLATSKVAKNHETNTKEKVNIKACEDCGAVAETAAASRDLAAMPDSSPEQISAPMDSFTCDNNQAKVLQVDNKRPNVNPDLELNLSNHQTLSAELNNTELNNTELNNTDSEESPSKGSLQAALSAFERTMEKSKTIGDHQELEGTSASIFMIDTNNTREQYNVQFVTNDRNTVQAQAKNHHKETVIQISTVQERSKSFPSSVKFTHCPGICFSIMRLFKASDSKPQLTKAGRKDLKAAKSLFIFVFTFLILWAPYTIATVVISFCEECVNEDIYEFFIWLLWCKSAVDPFLYAASNSRFKVNFVKILGKICFCCKVKWNILTFSLDN